MKESAVKCCPGGFQMVRCMATPTNPDCDDGLDDGVDGSGDDGDTADHFLGVW